MGTPARIYVKNTTERGGYDSIRVNYDGMDVGDTLKAHYNTPEAIAALLALGEASSLGDTTEPGVSIFYHRDRSEPLRRDWYRTTVYVSEDYTYRWDGEGWEVYDGNGWTEV